LPGHRRNFDRRQVAFVKRQTRIAFGGGNPVSSLVCGIVFLRPAIELLSGLPGDPPPVARAVLGAPLAANDRRADHLRASLSVGADGSLVATAFPRQDSATLRLLALADAFILREPEAPAAPAGASKALRSR
jgi:molybdopterin molybdotransferase